MAQLDEISGEKRKSKCEYKMKTKMKMGLRISLYWICENFSQTNFANEIQRFLKGGV